MPVQKPAKHGRDHTPGGEDPIPLPGEAVYSIKVFRDDIEVATGDGRFIFEVPEDLDGASLIRVEGYVTTVSSSGGLTVQVRNITQAHDMLSTGITIDVSELNSKDASSQPAVNGSNATVAWGDQIAVDVDNAGSGAKGLGVILFFTAQVDGFFIVRGPQGVQGDTGPTGDTGPQGPQGDPGGIVAWTGDWDSGTTYAADDAVSWNGSSYVAIQASTDVEPGVDAGWESYWMVLAAGAAPDGWTPAPETWTYASSTTFTVSGDLTEQFSKGTRIKLTQTTTKYFVVFRSAYSAGTTTVTISGGDDYSLANAAISNRYYSYAANPRGYPGYFNYTPIWRSSGTAPTLNNGTLTGRFGMTGKTVSFHMHFVRGSSSSNGTGIYAFTLPVAYNDSQGVVNAVAYVLDTGTAEYVGVSRGGLATDDLIIQMNTATVNGLLWAATSPFTLAAGDEARIAGSYEITIT